MTGERTPNGRIAEETLARLRRPLRLTRAGMAAERAARGFWPVWTILFALIAVFGLGLHDHLPVGALWALGAASLLALAWFVVAGLRAFRWPTREEALERLDETLPGRPIAAVRDAQATGQGDAGSQAVWRAHVRRMAERAGLARAPAPDLRLAARDPFALRYAALAALVIAAVFGSLWRITDAGGLAPGGAGAAVASGPSWEGWVEPPDYTGRPSLYLNDVKEEAIEVPEGSRVTLRLYGTPDEIEVRETVSGRAPAAPPAAEASNVAVLSVRSETFEAVASGTVAIEGAGGRTFTLTVMPDAAPEIALAGKIEREADGTMAQPFTAKDDYAVVAGRAVLALDLGAVTRRHGLSAEPEARDDLIFDLPMPITGSRAEFTEALVEDASKHPWANLPVKMTLTVEDARGQTGATAPESLILPGRRFFDPVAAAVIELRRDLLWTRENGARVSQILRAVTNRPEGLLRNERAYLMLRVAMRQLDSGLAQGELSPEARDELAEALWEIAVLIEDGGLADALERMRQAQERLSEAIRNGASPEEIQRLMDELRQATDDYIRMLAENMQPQDGDGTDERDMAENQGQQITGDQIQQMMDEIQRLMEEGRMAEAQELLDQLSRMLENLQVTQGEGGEGMQGPGGQAMRNLQDTLRQQQGLSDEAFGDLQEQFNPGGGGERQRPGENQGQEQGQNQGQDGQQGEGQDGEGQGDDRSLADRQEALRDQLRRQSQGPLPGQGTEEGRAAREALDQAGRAMEEAEEALRDGDLGRAIDRQAEAIENLREGLRGLGDAIARENGDQTGQQGEAFGEAGREMPRDPLGRSMGSDGRIGTDENMLQGEDVYRRAEELLGEIRRRSGEQTRPETERDYLRRLLDSF